MPGGGYPRSKGWEPREGEFFGKRDCRGEGTEEGERRLEREAGPGLSEAAGVGVVGSVGWGQVGGSFYLIS